MKSIIVTCLVVILINTAHSYSKYGRTCKDIGCGTSEECVMAETPCSYYTRQDECGLYPTCKRVGNSAPTCATYICPPTKKCVLDGDTPKCVDDANAHTPDNPKVHQTLQTYNSDDNPNAPSAPQPAYPVIPGQTTTRRPVMRPPSGGGGGYSGGSVGSGYPGGYSGGNPGSGYPTQQGGYQQPGSYQQGGGGYQQPGYQGGYQGGYQQPGYQGGYQQPGYQGGYQQPGYQGGYQQPGYQGGYQQPGHGQSGYGQNRYGQSPQTPAKSNSNPLVDTLKGTLTNIGTNFLKKALSNIKLN